MMLDIPKIRAILQNASHWDMDFPLFGSHAHAHLLQPPLPLAELEAWEELMQITLPADYRTYLTCLGNGGAGPGYGINPFPCPLDDDLPKPTVFSDDSQSRFDQLSRQWYEYSNSDESTLYEEYCLHTAEEDRLSFVDWDERRDLFIDHTIRQYLFQNGQLYIANQGCSNDIYLLLNGSHGGFCHSNSTEFDYSAPCRSQKAGHYGAITWPQYRETLTSFADYLMHYVGAVEQVCTSLPFEKLAQFHRERVQAQDFYRAAEAGDWELVLSMLTRLTPTALSIKSRSFYLYYREPLSQMFPDRPEVLSFFQKLDRTRRSTSVAEAAEFTPLRRSPRASGPSPYPSFQQFVQAFFEAPTETASP